MKDFSQIRRELEKFGLSENQADIYMLLVEHKELRIQEIVKLAKIPRSSVYACLKGLFELGIAEEITEDSFKKIRPYSIGTMHHGLDEKMLELQRLKNDLSSLEKTLVLSPPHGTTDTTSVRKYKGRSGARQMFWNSLGTTTITYVYSDWGRGRYIGMKFYESFVQEWRFRKLKEKVIINLTPENLESIRQYTYPGSPISRTKIEDIRIVEKDMVLIKGDTLIYDNVYAQIYLKNVEINGFEIENMHFAQSQRSIFETIWNLGKPVSAYI